MTSDALWDERKAARAFAEDCDLDTSLVHLLRDSLSDALVAKDDLDSLFKSRTVALTAIHCLGRAVQEIDGLVAEIEELVDDRQTALKALCGSEARVRELEEQIAAPYQPDPSVRECLDLMACKVRRASDWLLLFSFDGEAAVLTSTLAGATWLVDRMAEQGADFVAMTACACNDLPDELSRAHQRGQDLLEI
jgi:hypothetical protein